MRRASTPNTSRIDHLYQDPHAPKRRFFLHYGDVSDGSALREIIRKARPNEVYNLAAQAHVKTSFDIPENTIDVTGAGVIRVLEAVRSYRDETKKDVRFYQASSSEMFGAAAAPQSEETPFDPQSPYACAKIMGYYLTINYRKAYGLHASNGILFNHESPRRGLTFVTRKITHDLALVKHGERDAVYLGNLNARRDWGYAPDYVEGMWRMVQARIPGDYILATGESYSVREFAERAAAAIGYELVWSGKGRKEVGKDRASGKTLIKIDPRYFRPAEVDVLCGDPSKAERVLQWRSRTSFNELVELMAQADYDAVAAKKR
jgi:GDPmannose 4,6-dehydratase